MNWNTEAEFEALVARGRFTDRDIEILALMADQDLDAAGEDPWEDVAELMDPAELDGTSPVLVSDLDWDAVS